MIRSSGIGPRSFTRTKMDLWFLRLVTLIQLPRGKLRCAQVRAYILKDSPFAVVCPWKRLPYHEAWPIWYQWCALGLCPDWVADSFAAGAGSLAAEAATPKAIINVTTTTPPFIKVTLRSRIVEGISFMHSPVIIVLS